MILGISHITLLTHDFEKALGSLRTLGYRLLFIEKNVPNYVEKNRFLRTPTDTHSLAFCQDENGIPIELISYDDSKMITGSFFQPLLGLTEYRQEVFLKTKNGPWEPVWLMALRSKPEYVSSPILNTAFWFDKHTSQRNGLHTILAPVSDIDSSKGFWEQGLGYTKIGEGITRSGQAWAHLSFRAPIKTWSLGVILAEGETGTSQPMLDDPGFSCLAILTTNLEKERTRIEQAGAIDSTGEFIMTLNNKHLRIEVFRGPSGELIELLEILDM